MYKLTFKGKDSEPLFLDDEKGKAVLDAYLQNKSVRLVANNQAFNTGDIKSIFLVEKNRSEIYAPSTQNKELEYNTFRKKMLTLSLEERSKILRFAKIVWEATTDEPITETAKEKIRARQLEYFEKHPNCIYANPACYRDLIPVRRETLVRDGVKHINQIVGASMLRFIENAISTDLELASQTK